MIWVFALVAAGSKLLFADCAVIKIYVQLPHLTFRNVDLSLNCFRLCSHTVNTKILFLL